MTEQPQKTRTFALSILAGFIGGGILAGISATLVQSSTTGLTDVEIENLLSEGEFDEEEFDLQLQSIRYFQLYGSVIIGLVAGALLGGIFLISRIRTRPLKAALMIAGIAWFVLYVIPTVKYPPSFEAMFNPEAAVKYQTLLAGYTVISGLSALTTVAAFSKVKKKGKMLAAAAIYLISIAVAYFVFPDYVSENDSVLPQQALAAWRSAVSLSMTVFWLSLGVAGGLLWTYGTKSVDKFA